MDLISFKTFDLDLKLMTLLRYSQMTDKASKHLKQTNTFLVCYVPK